MSITEQIAMLESEKHMCIQQFDQQITALRMQKHDACAPEPDEVVLPSGRRLIKSGGRTLSQIIMDDRGSY